jgi:citrate synthase
VAHWKQALDSSGAKIWRPRQVYVGEKLRDYVPMEQRAAKEIVDSKDGVKELPHYQSKRRLGAKL